MSRYRYDESSGGWFWGDYPCPDADAETFAPHNDWWATDKKGLLCGNTRRRVKDRATIRVLNSHFAKDSQQVYYLEGVAKAVVDPASFEVLTDPTAPAGEERSHCYARDKIHVYYASLMSGTPRVLRKADRNTFRVIADGRGMDHRHVWAADKLMKGADPATFEVIRHMHSKDARRVYYWETALPDADPATFRVIGRTTGVDKSNVYVDRERVPGADPLTYQCDKLDRFPEDDG